MDKYIEWLKEYSGAHVTHPDRREVFEAGAASRQDEIDALKTLGEMSEQKIDDLVLRNIELQNRIDEALKYIDNEIEKYGSNDDLYFTQLILRGEQNEK